MNTLNGHHLDVLFRADEVLLDCTEPGGVDLDAAGSVLLTPAQARALAADLLDAAIKAETAPPARRTLHLVRGTP